MTMENIKNILSVILNKINKLYEIVDSSVLISVCNFTKKSIFSNIETIQNDIKNTIIYLDDRNNTGNISDGYHTFNELYHHRAILFSVICNQYPELSWKSLQHHDPNDPMYDGMFIVGINTPTGQATYHYNIDPYWDLFKVEELDRAPKWDGHTPDEAIQRISTLEPKLVYDLNDLVDICDL